MPMENIEFIVCEAIDSVKDELVREVVPGCINHHSSMAESGLVSDA